MTPLLATASMNALEIRLPLSSDTAESCDEKAKMQMAK